AREIVNAARALDFQVRMAGAFVFRGGGEQPISVREIAGRFAQPAALPLGVAIEPQTQKSSGPGVFQVHVTNPALTPVEVAFAAGDPDGALLFEFRPSKLALAPDNTGQTKLVVKLKEGLKNRKEVAHSFSVTATPTANDDAFPGTVPATFVALPSCGCCLL